MKLSLIPWGRIGIAVGLLAVTALFAAYKIEERRADKLQGQLEKYRVELGRISSELGEQKKVSARTVTRTVTLTREAKTRSQRLEAAPAANQCVTKPEVLGEDL